jgi:hypothetical protein
MFLSPACLQENEAMVLEVVFSDDDKEHAQKTSKQIWDILYKDTVDPDALVTNDGGDDGDDEAAGGEGDDEDGVGADEDGRGQAPLDNSESNSDDEETACTSVGFEP